MNRLRQRARSLQRRSNVRSGCDAHDVPADRPTIEALVDIRLQLSDAHRQSRSAMPHDRVRAVVSLDAVVERAVYFAAHYRLLEVEERATHIKLLPRLAADLGASWKFTGRQELVRLHSARNKAQHEGLFPALEHIPTFVAVVDEAVSGLLLAVTGQDVRRVVIAEAVNDPEVRAALAQAERLRDEDSDPGEVVRACAVAFELAHERWSIQRRASGQRLETRSRFGLGFSEFRELSGDIASLARQLEDNADASAFSVDPGEVVWFRHLVSDVKASDATVSKAEADRALSFVFEWTLRWERLADSLLPDRTLRWRRARRSIRASSTVTPRVTTTDFQRSTSSADAIFQLVDVPDVEEYEAWQVALEKHLNALGRVRGLQAHWSVGDTGEVHLALYPDPKPDRATVHQVHNEAEITQGALVPPQAFQSAARRLASALEKIESLMAAEAAARAQAMRQRAEQDAELEASVSGSMPVWVTAIRYDRPSWLSNEADQTSPPKVYLLAAAIDLPAGRLAELVRESSDVAQFYPGLDDWFHYQPAAHVSDPLAPLHAVTARLACAVSARAKAISELSHWREQAAASFAAGIAEGPE